ncbi:hypothetical protein [Pseudogulbenkiania sp. MAI-1]|uniref:hypothetical protein n=1 Tax=Pseudogulbenkiania sp. MAI-1 TaxID=990370 RepID=UPI00045E602B|nr:hypothetical protein [Pseudogulbenkiania sp. MAI-1]
MKPGAGRQPDEREACSAEAGQVVTTLGLGNGNWPDMTGRLIHEQSERNGAHIIPRPVCEPPPNGGAAFQINKRP